MEAFIAEIEVAQYSKIVTGIYLLKFFNIQGGIGFIKCFDSVKEIV